MPTGARVRSNNVFGKISDNPLAPASTIFNSPQLILMPTIFGDHAVVTLDPLRQFGDPEIVIVTTHTPASTSATITRGAYGTVAREHPFGTVWVHALIDEDTTEILTSSTRPNDPYQGQTIFETDTNRYVGRSTSGVWQQHGLFFDPPACLLQRSATQSISDATPTIIGYNVERYDTDSMHDNVTNNSRITVNTSGLYLIQGGVSLSPRSDWRSIRVAFLLNGGTVLARDRKLININASGTLNENMEFTFSKVRDLVAGNYIELEVYQDNTGGAAVTYGNNELGFFAATWIGRGN